VKPGERLPDHRPVCDWHQPGYFLRVSQDEPSRLHG